MPSPSPSANSMSSLQEDESNSNTLPRLKYKVNDTLPVVSLQIVEHSIRRKKTIQSVEKLFEFDWFKLIHPSVELLRRTTLAN